MSRYDEINISGWWTINFMGNYDGIGCVICNIKEDKNYIPECVGDKKYLFQLNDKHYITKYKFRDAIGIVNQNEIKKWEVIDEDDINLSVELGNVTGKVQLDNRFIKLYSSKVKQDLLERREKALENNKKYEKDDLDEGLICLFERLEMINNPLEYLIVLKREKSKFKNKIRKRFAKLKKVDKFNLAILFEDELITHNYSVKNILMYNTLYVKLPKSGIWTPHKEWDGDYFDEQMNELISIFRSFNAKSINYSITKNVECTQSYGAEIGCMGKSGKGNSNEDNKKATSLSYCIRYDNPLSKDKVKKIIPEALYDYDNLDSKSYYPLRNLNFYYFWKHPEWIEQMKHRTEGKCNEMDFSHEETLSSNITKSISTCLDKLNISYEKNHNSLIKYNILFNITYF